ncbi:MAG: RNA methyltransferase [Anaerolineaceae bacterium]|nr:RNA methyltransferase [Anaerolineaceae bacterium]
MVGEAIRVDFSLESILYCSDLLTSRFGWKMIEEGKKKGINLVEVTKDAFQSFAIKERPQGISAVGFQKWENIKELNQLKGLWIALDNIQDPGNLGTIMRSLDGVGGRGLILLGNTTDPYHPTSVRSSTGAIFTLKIRKESPKDLIDWNLKKGIPIIGAVCGEATNYREYNFPQEMVLLMGSEQKGIRKDLLKMCDGVVTIPMTGSVDSLNLACSASIILFEIYAKRIKT